MSGRGEISTSVFAFLGSLFPIPFYPIQPQHNLPSLWALLVYPLLVFSFKSGIGLLSVLFFFPV